MSVILITKHDESIYDHRNEKLLKRDKGLGKSRSAAATNCRDYIRQERKFDKNLKPHALMGDNNRSLPDPKQFLRKNTNEQRKLLISQQKREEIKKEEAKRPILVKSQRLAYRTREEIIEFDKKRELEDKNRKNFLRENINNALKLKPKEPKPAIAVENHGIKKSFGLVPTNIKARNYGKTPPYLKRFIEIREKLYQLEKQKTAGGDQPKYHYIKREERDKILHGLKHNWEELQKEYQKLPILTDTIPKKLKKTKLENELKQLEKDICLIERHPYIYVYNDDVESLN